jgi:hypothetical protein
VLKIVTDYFPIWIESRHLQTLFSGIFFAKIGERKEGDTTLMGSGLVPN